MWQNLELNGTSARMRTTGHAGGVVSHGVLRARDCVANAEVGTNVQAVKKPTPSSPKGARGDIPARLSSRITRSPRGIGATALLLTGLLLAGGSAFAQTRVPAGYLFQAAAMQFCPNLERRGYRRCEDAMQALEKTAKACSPPGTLVDTQGCSDSVTVVGVWAAEPGGSWAPKHNVQAYCVGSTNLDYVPGFGMTCPQPPFARLLNLGNPKVCVANPCNPANGNKFQVETDYVGPGPYPLRFVRYYNSLLDYDSRAGIGASWTHTYSRRLHYNPNITSLSLILAIREDGKGIPFTLSGGAYVTGAIFTEKLERVTGGWRLQNAEDEIESYDDSGRLISIADRAGRVQALTYDPAGELAAVTDPFGRTLFFSRDNLSQIQSITLPGAQSLQYQYGGSYNTRLLKVVYPDAKSRTYLYENASFPAHLTGITDENGRRFATYAYDAQGLAVLSEHAGSAGKHTIVNDTSSTSRNVAITRYIDSAQSASRSYAFQSNQSVALNTAIQGPPCPDCGPAASAYDANGNLASRTDWNGNRTDFAYDLARNLETSRTEGLGSAGAATPQTRTISTAWHPGFRLPVGVAEPLRITSYVYNGDGGAQCGLKSDGVSLVPGVLCSKTVQATSDANGTLGFSATPIGAPRVWSYTYNADAQVLIADGPRADVADVTTYTYYANDDADPGKRGNVATITNAAGHVTSIGAYNAHGQPLAIVDPNGLTTSLAYDDRRRLTSRSVSGQTTSYTYDAAGQLTRVSLPDGSFLSYSYDAAHRLTGIADSLGNRIAYTLDFAGNRTKEEVFDPLDTLAQTRSRVIDNLNRLFREVGAAGQTTEYAYDDQGNLTAVKDPLLRVTSNAYDELNRMRQVTDPNLGVTRYAYNGLDALTRVTDPRGLATGYSVDGLGNLTQQTSPDTGTSASSFDDAGNLLTRTDARGQVTRYQYDALNRVTRISFHDGTKQIYAYDQGPNGIGRLTSVTEADAQDRVGSVLAYGYDAHGRVIADTRSIAGVAYASAYGYDAAGRLSSITYPSGRRLAYGFDSVGRVSRIDSTQGNVTQVVVQDVQYHPFGGVKSYTLGNGQVVNRTIDLDGRIAGYTLGNAAYILSFDAASRITGIAQTGNAANVNAYAYDALDRLTAAVLPATVYGYAYDAVGNRVSKNAGSGTDTYAYAADSNRIAAIVPAAGPLQNFTFDANGSTTADWLNQYAYDARGRMVLAANAAGVTSYQVNPLGQRVRKTSASADTAFHYDIQGRLIAETDAAGLLKREFIYLGQIPVAVVQ